MRAEAMSLRNAQVAPSGFEMRGALVEIMGEIHVGMHMRNVSAAKRTKQRANRETYESVMEVGE